MELASLLTETKDMLAHPGDVQQVSSVRHSLAQMHERCRDVDAHDRELQQRIVSRQKEKQAVQQNIAQAEAELEAKRHAIEELEKSAQAVQAQVGASERSDKVEKMPKAAVLGLYREIFSTTLDMDSSDAFVRGSHTSKTTGDINRFCYDRSAVPEFELTNRLWDGLLA